MLVIEWVVKKLPGLNRVYAENNPNSNSVSLNSAISLANSNAMLTSLFSTWSVWKTWLELEMTIESINVPDEGRINASLDRHISPNRTHSVATSKYRLIRRQLNSKHPRKKQKKIRTSVANDYAWNSPDLRRTIWSSWESSMNPGTFLANSIICWIHSVSLVAHSDQTCSCVYKGENKN